MDSLDSQSLSKALAFSDNFTRVGEPLDAEPLIQAHSVTLHPHDEYKSYMIYGHIYVCDKVEGRNDLFKRGWNDPEAITTVSGNSLSLTGPVSGVISMVGEPRIFIKLKVRPKSRKKKGPIHWFAKVDSYLDTTTHLWYDEIKSLTLEGILGDVRVDYIVLPCACIADVEISLTREGEKSQKHNADDLYSDDFIADAHVFGSVTASYDSSVTSGGDCSYVKQHCSFILHRQTKDKCNPVPVAYGLPIKLDRSFVCMPAFASSSLFLTLNLTFKTCGDAENIIVDELTEFKTTDSICQQSFFSVRQFKFEVKLRLGTSDYPIFLQKTCKSPQLPPSALIDRRNLPKEIRLWGRDRIEVLSVFVGHYERKEIDELQGIVAVEFKLFKDNHCIFNRDVEHPDKLSRRGKALSLRGLTTEWTNMFYLRLKLMDISGLEIIDDSLFICERDYYIKRQWFDRPLCSVLFGKHGFAVVHYIIFRKAAKATVNISIVAKKASDHSLPAVYGALVAQYSNYEYPTTFQKNYWRSVLFEEPEEKDARHLSDDGEFPLSENVVSVPLGSSLVIDVDLHAIVQASAEGINDSFDVCNVAEHLKGIVEFEMGDFRCKKLLGEHFDVHFYIVWTDGK